MRYRYDVQTVIDDERKKYVIGCSECEYLHYYQRDCKTMKSARKGRTNCSVCSNPVQIIIDQKGGGIWDTPQQVHSTLLDDGTNAVRVTFGNGDVYKMDIEHVELSATHSDKSHRSDEYSVELNYNVPYADLPDGWETGFVSGYTDGQIHPTVDVHGERYDDDGNFIEWTFDGPRYVIASVEPIA